MNLSIGEAVQYPGNRIPRSVAVANAPSAAAYSDVPWIRTLPSRSASGASDRDLCSSREIVFNRLLNTNERGR